MNDYFAWKTPPVTFHYSDIQGGPDHLYGDCPGVRRMTRVVTPKREAPFRLPDAYGDVCRLCERRMLASGDCVEVSA